MKSLEHMLDKASRFWPGSLVKSGVLNIKMIGIGLVGILLLIVGGVLEGQPVKSENERVVEPVKAIQVNSLPYETALEEKLTAILSQVKGAGKVAVSITLENSSIQEHAKNVTTETRTVQEKDTSGGMRTTTESKESTQVLLGKENGADRPVTVREIKPSIKGVLVIAEGAVDSNVKANLTRAVEAGLGLPAYKITVLAQGR